MVKIKSPEESERNYVEDSYRRAYLKGIQSLNWMTGIIRATSLKGSALRAILDDVDRYVLKDEDSKKRAEELRKELDRLGY